jgi:hypothetical protein
MFKCLHAIKTFLTKHPEEFIILKLRGEGKNLKGFCKNIVADKIVSLFKDIMINGSDADSWFKIEDVTMGEIKDSKKSLLVLVDDKFYEGHLTFRGDECLESRDLSEPSLREKGIFLKDIFITDQKYKSDNIDTLIKKINESLLKRDETKLRVTQYNFTFQKKFSFKYLLKPPTVNKMEIREFQTNHKAMFHIIECIYNKQDINISNQN